MRRRGDEGDYHQDCPEVLSASKSQDIDDNQNGDKAGSQWAHSSSHCTRSTEQLTPSFNHTRTHSSRQRPPYKKEERKKEEEDFKHFEKFQVF